jgi:hypothetical protein
MGGRGSGGGGGGGGGSPGSEQKRSLQIHLSNGLSPQDATSRVRGTTIQQARAVQREMNTSSKKNTYRATDQQLH